MDEFHPSNIDDYDNFEDFFVRAHKAGSRPIQKPDDALSVVYFAQ
jgi:phosphatidylserine decarboxylase